jgi:hypothetical protein
LFKGVGVRWDFLTEKQKKDGRQESMLEKENTLNVDSRVSTLMRK